MSIPSLRRPIEIARRSRALPSGRREPKPEWRIGPSTRSSSTTSHPANRSYEGMPGIRVCWRACAASAGSPDGRRQYHRSQPERCFDQSGAGVNSSFQARRQVRPSDLRRGEHAPAQVREVAAEIGAGAIGWASRRLGRWKKPTRCPSSAIDHAALHAQGRRVRARDDVPHLQVQVNLDFSSEADMVKKFRVGFGAATRGDGPVRQSPFREGKPNGFLSYRSHIWTDVDNDRTGMLPWFRERHGL